MKRILLYDGLVMEEDYTKEDFMEAEKNVEETISELEKYEEFISDVKNGMSRFQIEKFVIGSEPPVGRYRQCCLEIKTRVAQVRKILLEQESVENASSILNEMKIFKELAQTWKPLVENMTEEQIEEVYWDQKFSFELAVRMISGAPLDDLLRRAVTLSPNSQCYRIFELMKQGQKDNLSREIKLVIDTFNSTTPLLE